MRTNKTSGLSKLQQWARDQRERARSTRESIEDLEAKEARIRQHAATMAAEQADKQGNADLVKWQVARQQRAPITDEKLKKLADTIRAGRATPGWNDALAWLNATGFFPSDRIDKNAPDEKIQQLALAAIRRIASSPRFRMTAEENLRKGGPTRD